MEKKVTIKQARRKHRVTRKNGSTLSLKAYARENAKLLGEPVGKLAKLAR